MIDLSKNFKLEFSFDNEGYKHSYVINKQTGEQTQVTEFNQETYEYNRGWRKKMEGIKYTWRILI